MSSAVRVALILAVLASPASAQTPEQLLAEGTALYEKNEYARVIEVVSRIPADASPSILTRKHRRLAMALMNLGRFSEVPAHVERTRVTAQATGDAEDLVNAAMIEGNFLRESRGGDRGIGALNRAVDLALKAGDRRVLGTAYGQLASAYQDIEDWDRAMHYNEQGFKLLDAPTLDQRFNHAIRTGIASFEQFDRATAEASFESGLALALESGGQRNESFARGELALTYWTFDRDAPRALALYDEAVALAAAARVPTLEATWSLNRGNVFRDTQQHARALDDYRRAIAVEEAAGLTGVRFILTKNIGQTYRLMGDLGRARAVLEPLVERQPWRPGLRSLWQAHMELASTYEALGMREQAETQFRQMLSVLEEQRDTAILDTFRAGSFARNLDAYDPYDRYIRFLLSPAGGAGRAADALLVAEQARARGFLEMLKDARSVVAARLPVDLLDEQTHILRGISGVQQRLRARDRPGPERERLLAELAGLEGDREAFRLKLRLEQPSLAEARYPTLAPAADLQAALRPGEVALAYLLAEPESFRWEVRRDGVTPHRLKGRAAVEAQVERVRTLIRTPGDPAKVRSEAAALAALLLDGVEVDAQASLVIIPHGALNYLPFEILPLGGTLLIERHPISYAPSLNSLAYLRGRQPGPSSFRVLAVGNPTVRGPTSAADVTRAGDVENLALLGPLPYAEAELDAIRGRFPSATDTLSGDEAREGAFRQAGLAGFSVIHFATHGLVSETHPTRSGLLFSPEPGEDGLLQLSEIYALGLRSDLVVLSACQTALGREITGEGIIGLTRAFFYAGSRAVMATLWNLNDRFAAEFVERFYGEVAGGVALEEALRRTKLAYVNDPRYGHPFYWSSFVLAGDGTRVLTPPPRDNRTTTVLAVLLVLAVAGLGLWYRRRVMEF